MNVVGGRRPYNQVARAERQQHTHEALLDAADEAFFSGRWEQTSLAEIAAAAGVTKQTLLRHFGSKEGLFEQASSRGVQRVRDQRWSTPRDNVPGAVDNLLDHYEQSGERGMKLADAGPSNQVMAEIGRAGRRLHYDWVDHAFGIPLGRLDSELRARARAALIALCDVHVWWLLSHDLGLARAELRATLIQAISGLLEEETT